MERQLNESVSKTNEPVMNQCLHSESATETFVMERSFSVHWKDSAQRIESMNVIFSERYFTYVAIQADLFSNSICYSPI